MDPMEVTVFETSPYNRPTTSSLNESDGRHSNSNDSIAKTSTTDQVCLASQSSTEIEDDHLKDCINKFASIKREKRIDYALRQHSELRRQLSVKQERYYRAGENSVLSIDIEDALQQLEDIILPTATSADCQKLFMKCRESIKDQLVNQYKSHNQKNSKLEKELQEARQEITQLKEELGRSYSTIIRDDDTPVLINGPRPPKEMCHESCRMRTININVSETDQRRKLYGDISGAPTEAALNSACMSNLRISPPSKGVTLYQSLTITLNLIIEALATQTRAQQVRLFFKDEKNNYMLCGVFPRKNYEVAPSLDDIDRNHRRLGRTIMTCATRNIAIVGVHEESFYPNLSTSNVSKSTSVDLREKKLNGNSLYKGRSHKDRNEKVTGNVGAQADKVYSYLCWPVRSPNSPSEAKGVVELVNKIDTIEDITKTRLQNFTGDDENAVHITSRLIGALIARYPIIDNRVFLEHSNSNGCKSDVPSILDHFQQSAGFNASHVTFGKYHEEVTDVEAIVNRALHSDIDLPVFRGPMHSIRSRMGRLGDDLHDRISEYQIIPPSQLTMIDYTLEALRSMWLEGHEENKIMHEKCRYWSGRVKSLSDITKCFSEAVHKARQMKTVEDIKIFLQTLDLLVRSGNSDSFLTTVAEIGEGTATAKEILAANRITNVDSGPLNVRTYTIDVNKKRQQQRDIQKLSDEVEQTILANYLAQQPPRHQQMTSLTKIRALPPVRNTFRSK